MSWPCRKARQPCWRNCMRGSGGAGWSWRWEPYIPGAFILERGGKAVRFEVPPRVQAYVQAIVETCAHGGMELVSLVLFGSAAIGGWREGASDADLSLVVPDGASDESRLRLRCEVERIELLHGLRIDPDRRQGAPEIMLNKVTATDKSFFSCAGPSAIVVAKG